MSRARTPTFEEAVSFVVERALAGVRTATPARIESWNPATRLAVVQPEIHRTDEEGNELTIPALSDVPVVMPVFDGGNGMISFPLARGDKVLLVCSDRSLDGWLQGLEGKPSATRTHSLADAIAIPGMQPSKGATSADPADLVVTYGGAEVRITKAGKLTLTAGSPVPTTITIDNTGAVSISLAVGARFAVGNSAAELMQILFELLQGLATGVTVIGAPGSAVPLSTAPVFAKLMAQLNLIKGSV